MAKKKVVVDDRPIYTSRIDLDVLENIFSGAPYENLKIRYSTESGEENYTIIDHVGDVTISICRREGYEDYEYSVLINERNIETFQYYFWMDRPEDIKTRTEINKRVAKIFNEALTRRQIYEQNKIKQTSNMLLKKEYRS